MHENKPLLGFIGAGRVGKALSRAFARAGEQVTAAWSRSSASLRALAEAAPGCEAVDRAQDVIDRCDIVFLCVPDDAIAPVAGSLQWRSGMGAVHCSGAAGLVVLERAAPGATAGGFHPLQMFADPDLGAAGLRGCSIAVEAAPPLLAGLERLAAALGSHVLRVPPGQRAAYHAASHYAAAFLCVLLAEGEAVFERIGFDSEAAREALIPLARSALDAVEKQGPALAMAGTYSRGDVGTATRHVDALEALDPALLPLYRMLAQRSVSLALESGRIDEARAVALRAVLQASRKPSAAGVAEPE